MHAFSNSLRDVFAHWKTGMLAFRLRRTGDFVEEQKKALEQLLEGFSKSDFGRAHKLLPGLSYSQFRERVPPQSYDTLAPLIEQVIEGVPDVLWPGICRRFVSMQRLPGETERLLPISNDQAWHVRRAWRRSLLQLAHRGAPVSVVRANEMWLGADSTLQVFNDGSKDRSGGDLLDILVSSLKEDFSITCHHVAQGAKTESAAPAEPSPLEPTLIVVRNYGQLAAFLHSKGLSFFSQAKPPIILVGPCYGTQTLPSPVPMVEDTCFHEVFACEAGIIAAQDGDSELGLRLFSDAGLFMEFIPLAEYSAGRIVDLDSKVVALENVKTGVDYVLLVTSPAGLCRYATGELVRFVSTVPHRIRRMGHVNRLLNALGEKVNEQQISECLLSTCLPLHWSVVHFHVAPVILNSLTGSVRGHHEWWLELKPGTRETPTGPMLAEKLDKALQAENPDYAQRRKTGTLGAPVVRLVMPGIFEQWLIQNGLNEERHLIPPCLPNRPIADALAKLVRFYD